MNTAARWQALLGGVALAVSAAARLSAATFTVTSNADSGPGTLRQAILDANAAAGFDTIEFNLFVEDQVIEPATALPAVTGPTLIDGTTEPGYFDFPAIEIANVNGIGLRLAGGGSTIRAILVRGCTTGIQLESSGNHVEKCFLGVDSTGSAAAPNGTGISVQAGANDNTIGGPTDFQSGDSLGNVISGNATGILVLNNDGTVIQGNVIGLSASGSVAVANGEGITAALTTNLLIGGLDLGTPNLISGNTGDGIHLSQGSGAEILGNRIGTDPIGLSAMPNQNGIHATNHSGLVVGGDIEAGEGNHIAGNRKDGILVESVGAEIRGNIIGCDLVGENPIPNDVGIELAPSATDALIGDPTGIYGSLIAYNRIGILNAGARNAIRVNAIWSNSRLGIDNVPEGVTKNDAGDADTGANGLQNFPFIVSSGGDQIHVHVQGSLKSKAGETFDLDFYADSVCTPHPRDFLQGHYYIGTLPVTTDGTGSATFDHTFTTFLLEEDPPITATATDSDGNTSEFSQRVIYASQPRSGSESGGTTVTLTGAHFLDGATVTFGGVPGTGVDVADETTLQVTTPALAVASVNDIHVANTDGTEGTLARAWITDFLDVPPGQQFHDLVTTLVSNGVTAGVGGGNYGVGQSTLRQQMAVFLLKGRHGLCYTPDPCFGLFSDVPCPSTFADWIEALYYEGITGGCGTDTYCPQNPVRRDQMAVFLLKARHGADYVPPDCTGVFPDVPCPGQFADWIEQLATEAITGGCGGGKYCPSSPNTRGQMAVFISKAFGLQ